MIYDAIVIGSGAAGYCAAERLHSYGVTNIAVVTNGKLFGTSRNCGSDKQTYYKISLDGASDSAYDMARDITAGGSCDGELAYVEAVNSARCFLHLVECGVSFPTDDYGGFSGYRTDHDITTRATSIGPLTSKIMTEILEQKVLANGTPILEGLQVVKLLVKDNRVYGILALDNTSNAIVRILSKHVVVASGAPAGIYAQSVYPITQRGMTGALIDAGAELVNFSEWQYGLAATDIRWNLSGSYMQVIPRFYSVDEDGNEYDFLNEYFETPKLYNMIFDKGYEWPFSVERINASSNIDCVVRLQNIKGRNVYLDYTRNPKDFDFNTLSDVARNYLNATGATGDTPFERLKQMNPKAVELFLSKSIDLGTTPIRISVCAQHNLGGALVDKQYQSTVSNLYVIGEAAGVFGLTRQGGTALNSTQVGGLISAYSIAKKCEDYLFDESAGEEEERAYQHIVDSFQPRQSNTFSIAVKMSRFASFVRQKELIDKLLIEVESVQQMGVKATSISEYFYDNDTLIATKALLQSMRDTSHIGSRGGAMYYEGDELVLENKDYRNFRAVLKRGKTEFVPVSQVPKINAVFEELLRGVKI